MTQHDNSEDGSLLLGVVVYACASLDYMMAEGEEWCGGGGASE